MHHFYNRQYCECLMKVHRKRVILLFALYMIFSLTACSSSSDDGIQLCSKAFEKLEAMSEVHTIATSMTGISPSNLEVSATTESWISDTAWASKSKVPGGANLWHLMYQQDRFSGLEEDGYCQWQIDTSTQMNVPSRTPPLDLELFEVVSVKTQKGKKIVTLTADNLETQPHEHGSVSYSDVQAVICLDEFGELRSFELSYCITVSQAEGNVQETCWLLTIDYIADQDGEVVRYLEELHQEAKK